MQIAGTHSPLPGCHPSRTQRPGASGTEASGANAGAAPRGEASKQGRRPPHPHAPPAATLPRAAVPDSCGFAVLITVPLAACVTTTKRRRRAMLLWIDSEWGPERRPAPLRTALGPGTRVTSAPAYRSSIGNQGVDAAIRRGQRSQDLEREAGLGAGGRKWSGRRGPRRGGRNKTKRPREASFKAARRKGHGSPWERSGLLGF